MTEKKMTSILFIDDEENIINSIRRWAVLLDEPWDIQFAYSGEEGLGIMQQTRFDIIISDMRMPGMNGAELLTQVMKKYPDSIRMILSGHSDQDLILRSVTCTHQFLSKPFVPAQLHETIRRAINLKTLLSNEIICRLVAGLKELPSPPGIYTRLMDRLQKPNVTMRDIGEIVVQDIAMTAKILQLVNSSFFGLSRKITDIHRAIIYLGIDTLRSLILNVGIFTPGEEKLGKSLERISSHCVRVANLAWKIAKSQTQDKAIIENSFIAGLLHDVGKVLLLRQSSLYADLLEKSQGECLPLLEQERGLFGGATHAEIGAYLLGMWGLQNNVIEAVAFHHVPAKIQSDAFLPLTAVHIADALIVQQTSAPHDMLSAAIDIDYVHRLGLGNRIAEWRRELLQGDSEVL